MDALGGWLSARHSLANLEENILQQRQKDIFNVFGGFRGLLNALLRSENNLNRNEFQSLINIFTREDDDDTESKMNIDASPDRNITSLSNNVLSYMCNFLDFRSLTQFELTSANTAMICHRPESVYDFQSPLDDICSPRFFQRLVVQANKHYDFHRFSLIKLHRLDFYKIFDPDADHGSDSTNGQMENVKYYTKHLVPMITTSVINLSVSGRYNPKVTPTFPNVSTVEVVSNRMEINDIPKYAPSVLSLNISTFGIGLADLCAVMFDEAFKNINCLKLWGTTIGIQAYGLNDNENQVVVRNIMENKDDLKIDIDKSVAGKDKLQTLFLATPIFGYSSRTFLYPWVVILHSNTLQSLHVSLSVFYCEIPDFQKNNECLMMQSIFQKNGNTNSGEYNKLYNFPKLKELFIQIDKIPSGRNNPMQITMENIERLKITFDNVIEYFEWNLNRVTKCLHDVSSLKFVEIKYDLRTQRAKKIIKFTKTINSFLMRCIKEKKQKGQFEDNLYILLNVRNLANWDKEHNHATNESWKYLMDVFKTIQTNEKFKIRFKLIIECNDDRYEKDFKRITEQVTLWTKGDNKSDKGVDEKWTISNYVYKETKYKTSHLYYCKYQWIDYCIANWISEHDW